MYVHWRPLLSPSHICWCIPYMIFTIMYGKYWSRFVQYLEGCTSAETTEELLYSKEKDTLTCILNIASFHLPCYALSVIIKRWKQQSLSRNYCLVTPDILNKSHSHIANACVCVCVCVASLSPPLALQQIPMCCIAGGVPIWQEFGGLLLFRRHLGWLRFPFRDRLYRKTCCTILKL